MASSPDLTPAVVNIRALGFAPNVDARDTLVVRADPGIIREQVALFLTHTLLGWSAEDRYWRLDNPRARLAAWPEREPFDPGNPYSPARRPLIDVLLRLWKRASPAEPWTLEDPDLWLGSVIMQVANRDEWSVARVSPGPGLFDGLPAGATELMDAVMDRLRAMHPQGEKVRARQVTALPKPPAEHSGESHLKSEIVPEPVEVPARPVHPMIKRVGKTGRPGGDGAFRSDEEADARISETIRELLDEGKAATMPAVVTRLIRSKRVLGNFTERGLRYWIHDKLGFPDWPEYRNSRQ